MEDFKGLKEAVYGAENIIILTPGTPNQDAIGAALALFFSLKNIGKNVNLPTVSDASRAIARPSQKPAQKTFLISLKKDISEIYYEKKEGEVNLYLKPKKESINIGELSFKTMDRDLADLPSPGFFQKPDLMIALGVRTFQDVEKAIEDSPGKIPSHIKIINIDNSSLNQKYADFNLIKNFSSLSQTCAYFLKNLDPKIVDDNAASSLLRGAMSFLENPNEKSGQDLLPFLAWTIKKGGDLAPFLGDGGTNPAGKRLLDRTLRKLEPCGRGVCCSILTVKDFCLAQASSKDLGFVVEKLRSCFKSPSFLLLWESGSEKTAVKVMGIFYSDDKKEVEKIGRRFGGQSKGNGTLFAAKNPDLMLVQKEVLSAISK